jgi:hypothetical protein
VGNKNDYLTLEESALTLGRPVSFLTATISEGKLSAKAAGGRWLISLRDLDKLKRSLPPDPERIVPDFISDIPPKKPQPIPSTKPTIKTRDTPAAKSGASNSTPTESEPRRRMKDLDKQIRGINEQIKAEAQRHRRAVRSGSHSSKAALKNLLRQLWQLKKQRYEAQAALSKEAQARKKQTKKPKAKKQRGRSIYDVDDRARGHRLFGQIEALERRIKLESAKYKEAAQNGRFYDVEVLKRLVMERADLEKQYAKIPDPLGLLPPLVRAWPKKAGQQKGKAPKRPSGQGSSPAEVPKVPPSSVLPMRHLSWRVLPPGELSVNAVSQHYDRLQRQNPRIKYERERITKAFSLNPEQCYVGKDELEGYIVFTFAHTPKALLECPVFGNAIYIIDSDWKRWSRMTKRELLAHSHDVTRIIHRGDWFREVKRELGIR